MKHFQVFSSVPGEIFLLEMTAFRLTLSLTVWIGKVEGFENLTLSEVSDV